MSYKGLNNLNKRIGLIHSNRIAMEVLNKELIANLKGIDILNFLDESIVVEIRKSEGINPLVKSKFTRIVQSAIETSVDLILVSCSSISSLTHSMPANISVPIINVYELFFKEMVKGESRFLILGTGSSAIEAVKNGLETESSNTKTKPLIKTINCMQNREKKFLTGSNEYYQNIALSIEDILCEQNFDKVLLAQLSIIPSIKFLRKDLQKRIFNAIPFAIKHIKRVLY